MKGHPALRHIMSSCVFVFLLILAVGSTNSGEEKSGKEKSTPKLTQAHRDAVKTALKRFGYLGRYDLEVSGSGWLVVTLHLDAVPINQRAFGESALIAVRNELYPMGDFDRYRVSLRGPSPGPDLIRTYGAARFIEGSEVTWHEKL